MGLIYHRVGARTPSPVDIPLSAFVDHLDWLLAHRTISDLDAALDGLTVAGPDQPGGPPAVTLTFDDGTVDWPVVVLPALVQRGVPATFYVSTDFVERGASFPDEGRPVSWDGLAAMVSTGLVEIGSHTHTHRVLAHTTAREAQDELDRSIGLVEDRLGVACRHFAYPKAVAPSAAAEVVVRRRFASAVLAGNRVNHPGADPFRLGRHALTRSDGIAAFTAKATGGGRLEGWGREVRDAWRVRRTLPG